MTIESGPPADAEPHGQAALLLVESLIHGLTARSVLTVNDAIEILEVARDAQVAIADDGGATTTTARTTALLTSIVESLRIDAQE